MDTNSEWLANPRQCPVCHSTNLSYETIEVYGKEAYQEVTCTACESVWWEEYELTGFTLIKRGRGVK